MKKKNIYLEIFSCFSKIGAFTIGGGYAMIPIIENEVVEKRKWIAKDDFMEVLAISQSAPGLLAVNISIFLGYRLKGIKGSLVATSGSILPSFLIILAIAMLFRDYASYPAINAIFKGIRPVVVALIAVPAVNMIKSYNLSPVKIVIAVLVLAMISFAKIPATYILFTAAIISISCTIYKCRTENRAKK